MTTLSLRRVRAYIACVLFFISLMTPVAAQALAPTGRAELRCGTANEGDNADFTLFVGVRGFPSLASVDTVLQPENFFQGSSTTDVHGSFGNVYTQGYIEGFAGPFSNNPYTLPAGAHSLEYTDLSGDSATAPFTVPISCPPFAIDIFSFQGQDRVQRNSPFLVPIYSSPSFDATTRIDRNTFRAFLDDQTDVLFSYFATADVNNDGLPDLLCYSSISQSSTQVPAGNNALHVLGRTTDEGSSPSGFLYIKNDNFQLLN